MDLPELMTNEAKIINQTFIHKHHYVPAAMRALLSAVKTYGKDRPFILTA